MVTSRTEHHLRNTAAKFVRSLGETVTSVVISQDKHLFAAGATNKKAMVYQVANGQLVAEFTAESGINACAIGGAGYEARLVVGTFAGYIRVYHISSNREEHAIKFGNGDAVFCMALAAGGTRLAVGGKSAHVLLYALSFSSEAVGMNVLHKFATHSSSTLSTSTSAWHERLAEAEEEVLNGKGRCVRANNRRRNVTDYRTTVGER